MGTSSKNTEGTRGCEPANRGGTVSRQCQLRFAPHPNRLPTRFVEPSLCPLPDYISAIGRTSEILHEGALLDYFAIDMTSEVTLRFGRAVFVS